MILAKSVSSPFGHGHASATPAQEQVLALTGRQVDPLQAEHLLRVHKAAEGFRERQERKARPKIKKLKKPRREGDPPTEYQEQAIVCDWLKAHGVAYYAVPNGAFLAGDAVQRATRWRVMARIGCKSGVPDLVIVTPPPADPQARGVAIEMKRQQGGRLSPEQAQWVLDLAACGWRVCVARGAVGAIEFLQRLGFGAAR